MNIREFTETSFDDNMNQLNISIKINSGDTSYLLGKKDAYWDILRFIDNPKPLTLAELEQMEDEPVWIGADNKMACRVIKSIDSLRVRFTDDCWIDIVDIDDAIFYAHKPKEED